ncbi:MAG: TetR/AcrR family transcriptional regulator [Janthinobacterium lividum]
MATTDTRASSAAAASGEPRALRTRTLLVDALAELLTDHPLEAVSVSELCRRAGVNRATFYGHWADQRAFAAEVFADLIDGISDISPHRLEGVLDPAEAREVYAQALVQELVHVRANRPVLRTLFASDSDAGFRRRLTEALTHRAHLALAQWDRLGVLPAQTPPETAAFIAGGLVAALEAWAASGSEDVESAAARIQTLMPSWWPQA